MKKFSAILFLCFVFFVCGFNNAFFEYLIGLDEKAEVSFYCTEKNTGSFASEIKNGGGYVYSVQSENAHKTYENLLGCYGFSIKLKPETIDEILKKVHIVKTENLEGVKNFYGTAIGLVFFDFLDNKKINIQIAKTSSGVIVGSPIILGSY